MAPMVGPGAAELANALAAVRGRLLAAAGPRGHWRGELSSSALATALAVTALSRADPATHRGTIAAGCDWLKRTRNPDGGWGDTPSSRSSLPTSLLVWAALNGKAGCGIDRVAVEDHLRARIGSLEPAAVARAVIAAYGEDRTFSAPILSALALAGRIGPEPRCWGLVPQLPLELAVVPHRLLRWLRLPVVSYALPALVAIGLVRHHRARRGPWSGVRDLAEGRALEVLEGMQPTGGGFLEAIPLTAFVVLALVGAGRGDHPVVGRGLQFLLASRRDDGSWPIDRDLATWVTTLAVSALGPESLGRSRTAAIRQWLVGQQHRQEHPFTHAAPGGWGWSDLDGAVPDADDTAGALLALSEVDPGRVCGPAAAAGVRWLCDLQNRDGGIPTFCRGWGRLPFDRSAPDLTAHAVRALLAWRPALPAPLAARADSALQRALTYLAHSQRRDGAWAPLWFGNQWTEERTNLVYGTARVMGALRHPDLARRRRVARMMAAGRRFLLDVQRPDGGWGCDGGGRPTVEETSLALEALADYVGSASVGRGSAWLVDRVTADGQLQPAPIGLYFADLWYGEGLYPFLFAASALRQLHEVAERRSVVSERTEPVAACGGG